MAYSKPKPAFGIDQILNETHSSPNLLVSHPAQLAEPPPRASSYGIAHHEPMFDPYTLNMHPPSYFPANIPPPYFSPTCHHVADQYPPAIHKGTEEFLFTVYVTSEVRSSIATLSQANSSNLEMGKKSTVVT